MPAQITLVVVGLWLMFAPSVLGYGGAAATSDRIAGPVIVATAFLAVFAITRGLRWFNLPVGAWLIFAPWILDFEVQPTVSSMVCGVAALVLAPRGAVDQTRYGGGWLALRRADLLPGRQTE